MPIVLGVPSYGLSESALTACKEKRAKSGRCGESEAEVWCVFAQTLVYDDAHFAYDPEVRMLLKASWVQAESFMFRGIKSNAGVTRWLENIGKSGDAPVVAFDSSRTGGRVAQVFVMRAFGCLLPGQGASSHEFNNVNQTGFDFNLK